MRYPRDETVRCSKESAAGLSSFPLWAADAASNITDYLVVGSEMSASLVNLNKRTYQGLHLGFYPHSFIPHPDGGHKYLAVEKWGPQCAEVNFKTGKVKKIPSGKGFSFYGHGVYIKEKKLFFVTRVDTKTGKGHFIGYDPHSYKIQADYPVTPGGLHECHRASDNTYWVTSSGIHADDYGNPQKGKRVAMSSLINIDLLKNGKVLRELKLDDENQIAGHYAMSKSGAMVVLSGPNPEVVRGHGHIYFSLDGKSPLQKLALSEEITKQIAGEMLSVVMDDEETVAAVTNPMGRVVLLVDVKAGKIVKTLRQELHGIAYNSSIKKFVGSNRSIFVIEKDFSKIEEIPVASGTGFFGAHSLLQHS